MTVITVCKEPRETQIFHKGVIRWYINVFLCSVSHLWPTIETSRNNRCMVKITYNGSSWYILFTKHYSSPFCLFLLLCFFFLSPSSSSSTDQRSLRPKASKFMGYKSVDGWGFWVSEMTVCRLMFPDVSNEPNVFIFTSWGVIKHLV